MDVVIALLLPPLALAAALGWWILRRFPRIAPVGWKRVVVRVTAALVLAPAVAFAWDAACLRVSNADYVCLVCGRIERQRRFLDWPFETELRDTGADYAQRFVTQRQAAHAHDWHQESGVQTVAPFSDWRISCSMVTVGAWCRALPRLADRALADALYREALGLQRDARCDLMNAFGEAIGYDSTRADLDAVVRDWHAGREPVALAVRVVSGVARSPLANVWVVAGDLEWQLGRGSYGYVPGGGGTRTDAEGRAVVLAPKRQGVRLQVLDASRKDALTRLFVDVPSLATEQELEVVVP